MLASLTSLASLMFNTWCTYIALTWMTSMERICFRACPAGQARIQAFTLGDCVYAFPQGPWLSDLGLLAQLITFDHVDHGDHVDHVGPGPWNSLWRYRVGHLCDLSRSSVHFPQENTFPEVIHRDLKPENVLIVRTGSPANMRGHVGAHLVSLSNTSYRIL